jgi:hypothetical protein
MDNLDGVATLFADKTASVRAVYDQLLLALSELGSIVAEPKKTSIHLVRKTGFAGVHPRKNALNLEFKSDHAIEHPRITKCEQISKHRFHNTVKLTTASEIDAELLDWLRAAYAISG